MKLIEYKGYKTHIQYSKEDNVFWGSIININDHVSFHGETLEEAKNAFIEAIEDYIEFCKDLGKEPDKKSVASSQDLCDR